MRAILSTLLLAAGVLAAQTGARSARGTLAALKPDQGAFDLRLDSGGAETVILSADTVLQRVAPGETDLRNARPMKATDLAVGDRVLVTWVGGAEEARRVVVMGADEIVRKREQERLDWLRRGVAGVVDAVRSDRIVLKARSLGGEKIFTVHLRPETVFRRYRPDSVKFADAVASRLSEVRKGDQLRARGVKSGDGAAVDAEEVVFGTFVTRAGTVTSVDAARGEVRLKDLDSGKPLLVRAAADTQVRRMPEFEARPGGAPGAGAMGGIRAGAPASGPAGGVPDLSQMIERMPAARIEDLKPGETVVVSSSRETARDELTAILVLGNAARLVEMAAAQQQRQAGAMGMLAGGPGAGMNGGALGGLELPGMLP